MQLSIFNSLLPQVFTSQLNVLYIQAQPQVTVHNFLRPLPFWWAQMDSNHRRFGLRDFSNLKTVRKVYTFKPRNKKLLVGSNGLEPSTSRLSGVCSNQLSYEPVFGGDKRIRTVDPLLARQVL